MDIGKMTSMADDLFQGKDQMSKQEIQQKAQSSNLGDEEKGMLGQLPDGMFTKNEFVQKITDMATSKAGGGMGGMGGMFGR